MYHWDVLVTYHWDIVGCFIWDLFETSRRRTDGTSLLRFLETSSRHSNKMSWRRTTKTSWRHSTETSLGVSFGTYLRSYWDVQRDVVTTSLRRLAAGLVRNIAMLWKSFAGYPVKFLILTVSSIEMFLWTLLKPFFIESKELRVMFWKVLYQCLAAGKKI